MKKLLLAAVVVLCIAAGALTVQTMLRADRTPPEITCSEELLYAHDLSEKELLQGVTAQDQQDGDVTDSLVVESVSRNDAEKTAIVIYAARDESNNVSKASRVLRYSKEEEAAAQENESETETEDIQTVSGSVNGDPTKRETGDEDSKEEASDPETSEAETESESETELQSEPESEPEELEPGSPVIKLTETQAVIHVGDNFAPLNYVASVEDDYDNVYDLWQDIQLTGDYDTGKAGTYTLTFYVIDSAGNRSNSAKLRLRVEK